jgi:hypothetical protein
VESKGDGAVGLTPYSGWLRPGEQKITVEREGFEPVVKTVKIIAGEIHEVSATLKQVRYGWLRITGRTTTGSQVKINGKPIVCSEFPCRTHLAKGHYEVELTRPGYKPYSHQVQIAQASETQLAVRLNPKPSRVKAYVTFGVATALLGGAIASGVISKNARSSLEDDLEAGKIYDSEDERLIKGKVTAIVANSLFGLSGLVGALGVYYLFRNVGPDSYGETNTKKVAITPFLGPYTAGIGGNVRF